MASVYKGKRTLTGQARRYFMSSVVFFLLFAACALILARNGWGGSYMPLWGLPLAWLGGAAYARRKYRIFCAGAAGEARVLEAVKRLPRGYHVFTNYLMQGNGWRDEADFIIVGKNGIYLIEVKHHGGRIVGGQGKAGWKQKRAGRWRKMRNPVEQTTRHAVNLARLLRGRGCRIFVRGILVFTNPRVWLELESCAFTILRGEQNLNALILQGESRLDKDSVNEVVACLKAGP